MSLDFGSYTRFCVFHAYHFRSFRSYQEASLSDLIFWRWIILCFDHAIWLVKKRLWRNINQHCAAIWWAYLLTFSRRTCFPFKIHHPFAFGQEKWLWYRLVSYSYWSLGSLRTTATPCALDISLRHFLLLSSLNVQPAFKMLSFHQRHMFLF